MIFFKYSEAIPDIKERIDMAVFPALQGGPHNHQIGALGAQLLEVNTPSFVEYSKDVVSNAGTLAEALIAKGHKLASGGTDNHLVFWVLRPHGLTGSKVEKVCEAASISVNRNTVPGDASALSPGGVRIGAPAMTTRGCTTEDFKMIADFLHRCDSIALELGVGLKFRRDRRGSPQVLQVYFAAMWGSLDVPAPCDCSSAIKPSPTLRSRSPCASWAPPLHRGLVRGSFPAPHHHDPNETLPNFSIWVMVVSHSSQGHVEIRTGAEARILERSFQRVPRLHTDADPTSHRVRVWRGGVCVQSPTTSSFLSSSTPSRTP